ncbi:MAG: DNA gyrase subunit A, partial [Syntrophales bacterium]
MEQLFQKNIPINIEDEMKKSYMDYAMSVIIGRAIPDVRDGMKPVHRRVLFAMSEMGNVWNKAYKKSARIVGDIIGKYHPHGDTAAYDTLVRMAQDFSMRYPLIDGQGNFGCFTGDTKIKLLDGTERSFEELSRLKPDEVFNVYSVNGDGRIVVGEGRNARVTRRNAQLVELALDSGDTIRCTPDHRFMLRDGSYKEARQITPADSLMPGYFDSVPVKEGLNDYLRILQPSTGEYEFVHHLADELNLLKGKALKFNGPYVRHHRNFNRWDNRPENIRRMTFLEHLHLHANRISSLWEDETFRKRQSEGVKKYYDSNPTVRQERRRQIIEQNKSETFRNSQGVRLSPVLKKFYQDNPDKRAQISRQKKALWEDSRYRHKMRLALQGIQKRELSPQEKANVAKIISEKSRAMWGDEGKRAEIVEAINLAMASPGVRAKISRAVRRAWQEPSYRAKFPKEHFSRMARACWEQPETKIIHREKRLSQQTDPVFRVAQRVGVQRSNVRRMMENPKIMAELAEKAAQALTAKWTDARYKRQVIRSKVARYVSRLFVEMPGETITPQIYEERRRANWIPRLQTALSYFDTFDEILDSAVNYNHRIVGIRWLDKRADTYDIEVDEHHNFLLASGVFVHNSVDGDPPAAMRYTEIRMARLAEEMLADIEKETVDFVPNYDATMQEPTVLPARMPALLLNGTSGIAVGVATNIPPHNLGELVDGTIALIRDPEITINGLMVHIKGPDFPTAGFINGRDGIVSAYTTGRGSIRMRARASIERNARNDRESIVVTELPYLVNKANLIEKISELVKE